MKKVIVILLALLLSSSFLAAEELNVVSYDGSPIEASTKLDVYFGYNPEYYYKFKFSDVYVGKDGNFDDLFASEGLDWIMMDKLKSNRLYSDSNIYIYWQVDRLSPIRKMTIEMPEPLKLNDADELDWYTSVDDTEVLGGKNGYGIANAKTVYDRGEELVSFGYKDSVQLKMWTDDITGKKAGSYTGYLVLRVFGEI